MSNITEIKMYDEYGYEQVSMSVPPNPYEFQEIIEFSRALMSFGVSAEQAASNIKQVADIWKNISHNTNRIDNNEMRLQKLEDKNNNNPDIVRLKYEDGALRREINKLRSELGEMTETLNQKVDLEISKQKGQSSININLNRLEENIFLKDIHIDF